MSSRRRAREFCLQMLYQWDLRGCRPAEVLSNFWVDVTFANEEKAYAEQLFLGSTREVRTLDLTIERFSHKWRIERMPPIDRNVLRMGAFELFHIPDVPVSVTLNECIELGKRYSTTESGAFINGILDRIAHNLPPAVLKQKEASSNLLDSGAFLDDEEE